ncbi:hypothetical protein K5X82_05035 [Halosquirtibacter xylanolyticus]|uniref:hypothetical protein n=1 Tax=Halosquirtibacter xylanolyticus TaxID=3374599 RepID=UPI0037488B21|nr:hypothetical protein K5X82_05035 [Prolixibacteraceae bacterium]
MKRYLMILLFASLILGCNEPQNKRERVFGDTETLIMADAGDYIDKAYTQLNDSLERNAGFLGWRNIRDYYEMGDKKMQRRVKRIWFHFYKPRVVTRIIKHNLEDAFVSVGKDKLRVKVKKIDSQPVMDIYSHKIAISGIFLILEEIAEFILKLGIASLMVPLIVFLYVTFQFKYGGWKRWSNKRRKRVDEFSTKVWKWSKRVAGVSFIVGMLFCDNWAHMHMKAEIKREMMGQIHKQIDLNIKVLESDGKDI